MSNSPLVSILMNCYNSENYIEKAVNSVLEQKYKNWELIIWDDASTDDTIKKIKKFDDQRIKLFTNENHFGLGKSRINAIKNLNGSLIAILDSDDSYHVNKISKQVEIFEKFPEVSICATWAKVINEKNDLKYVINRKVDNEVLKKKLLCVNLINHSSIMYRKNSAKKVGWYSDLLEYSQDYDLTLKLLKGAKIYLIKDFLTNITDRKDNMTNLKSLNKTILKENIFILEKNKKNFILSSKEKKIINSIIDIYMVKLNIIEMKKNFILSIIGISKILLKNPFLLFKFNLIKSIKKD